MMGRSSIQDAWAGSRGGLDGLGPIWSVGHREVGHGGKGGMREVRSLAAEACWNTFALRSLGIPNPISGRTRQAGMRKVVSLP